MTITLRPYCLQITCPSEIWIPKLACNKKFKKETTKVSRRHRLRRNKIQCVTKDSYRNISKVIGHIVEDKEVMGREPKEANVEVKKLQDTEDKNLENLEIAYSIVFFRYERSI